MPYVTQSEIETAIPGPDLAQALDDDGDGAADAGLLDTIIAQAGLSVDGLLGARFAVPFADPVPAIVRHAAFVFAGELLYDRRPIGEKRNPFKTRANSERERLKAIGQGEQPLVAGQAPAFSPGAAITEALSIDGALR